MRGHTRYANGWLELASACCCIPLADPRQQFIEEVDLHVVGRSRITPVILRWKVHLRVEHQVKVRGCELAFICTFKPQVCSLFHIPG